MSKHPANGLRFTVLFFRQDGFYPIALLSPTQCGKSLAEQAAEHAALNPGTLRVEDMVGNVLWKQRADA